MEMYEHYLTVGLFDKETERQEVETNKAKGFIAETLINDFNVFAFTMIDAVGIYKMQSTSTIVKEPSIRIEIAAEADLTRETVYRIIKTLKDGLNQESIMYKMVESDVEFI